jgi:hypothetical protein
MPRPGVVCGVAVADLPGPDWPERARHARAHVTAERDGEASDRMASDRIRLLTDCRAAFGPFDGD